jgi:hypothetical protein
MSDWLIRVSKGEAVKMKSSMKPLSLSKGNATKSQSETLQDLNARCDGPNQFENFDRAFRHSLTLSKQAVEKEEERLKRARAKKRAAKKAD